MKKKLSLVSEFQEKVAAGLLKPGEEQEIGKNGLKKLLVKAGTGWEMPEPGDEVKGGSALLSRPGVAMLVDSCSSLHYPVLIAVKTMMKGEKALLTVRPKYGLSESLSTDLELVSWKTVEKIGQDGKITKKIIKASEGRGDGTMFFFMNNAAEEKLQNEKALYGRALAYTHIADFNLAESDINSAALGLAEFDIQKVSENRNLRMEYKSLNNKTLWPHVRKAEEGLGANKDVKGESHSLANKLWSHASKKEVFDAAGVSLVLVGPGTVDQKFMPIQPMLHLKRSNSSLARPPSLIPTVKAAMRVMGAHLEGYRQDWRLSFEKDTVQRGGWQQGGISIAGPGKDRLLYIHKDKEAGDEPDIKEVIAACCEKQNLS
ncbi:hypothetical protein SELMODRAFT_417123 [Selaginella moellendorffii]|uniref:Uncharacterized protein n=1 Tax=Selaginella moellendorffii TaxID=88036 RepID=D8S1F8_SELML|nr:hypothetical protein SELMODRAFT_417123 [Selaginella moellendorffii]